MSEELWLPILNIGALLVGGQGLNSDELTEELRLCQAASLLHHAAENIVAARLLLESSRYSSSPFAQESFSDAVQLGGDMSSGQHGVLMEDARNGTLPGAWDAIALMAKDTRLMLPTDLVDRVNVRLMLVGPACARVLLRLMAEPDQMISIEELARAAGIRSNSTRVIKVYICRLRRALAARAIPASAIDTGPRSYSLRGALFPSLSDFLAHG